MKTKLAPVDIFDIRRQTHYRDKLAQERADLWTKLRYEPTMYLDHPKEHREITERIRVITNTLNGHDSDIDFGVGWVNMYSNGGAYADKRDARMRVEVHEGLHESFLTNQGLLAPWVARARPEVWAKHPELQSGGELL